MASTPPLQLPVSPYLGEPDFARLHGRAGGRLDPVSLADLLRNGFVYAPHSIFEDVKLVTEGFDPLEDMSASPEFRFAFRDNRKRHDVQDTGQDWVGRYHRLLCNAVSRACAPMRTPWLLQSGGKDSTPLAIAAAEVRPDTTCITYLGGSEENEVASASFVAGRLGLRHETLVCDPGRAYDRYLAIVQRMPLLTADFALLSYVDLASEIGSGGGDGIVDGMGADGYFGWPMRRQQRVLSWLARNRRLPHWLTELPGVSRSFRLCYLLSSLQMDPVERVFPGSRFTDAEVDALFGCPIAARSRARLAPFRGELGSACSQDEWQAMAGTIAGVTGSFAKGLYTGNALSLQVAFPFCDDALRDWVYREVPRSQLVDPVTRANKVLVRKHIATHFDDLPYVNRKGSFRFDLCGLARARFEQVHDHAVAARQWLPGAPHWLERNRSRLGNKYHASKFYLLAVVLPWLVLREQAAVAKAAREDRVRRPAPAIAAAMPVDAGRRQLIAAAGLALLTTTASVFPASAQPLAPRKRGPARISVRDHGASGNGRKQDNAAFQAAIDALPKDGGTVIVPPGTYLIDPIRSVHLRDHMHLAMDPGARLIAKPNAAPRAYVLTVTDCREVEISGGRIIGERDEHLNSKGEWGHGIMVRGAVGLTLRGLHISRCWGDGISIAGLNGPANVPSRDVVVADVVCDGNRRQGLTIGGSRQVRVVRSSFLNTGGTLPEAGIDVEPDITRDARDITISHCLLEGNRGPGIQLYQRVQDTLIRRCTIRNNRGTGVIIVGAGSSVVADNVIAANGQRGLAVRGDSRDVLVSGNRFTGNATSIRATRRPDLKLRNLDVSASTVDVRIAADNRYD